MKRTIGILILLILCSVSVAAYYQVDYRRDAYAFYNNYYALDYRNTVTDNLPRTDPYYENYYDYYDFLSEDKYKRFIKTNHYQQATSPFLIVGSPYGAKNPAQPWGKVYGDYHLTGYPEERPKPLYNPFYGFPYVRMKLCYGPDSCRIQNVFPNSNALIS